VSYLKRFQPILGITLAIFGLTVLYQWFGILLIYLMPIPFVIFSFQQGLKKGLWVTIITSILALLLRDPGYYFLILLGGSVGTVMGSLYHTKGLLPAIIGGFLATLLNMVLLIFFIENILHLDLVEYMRNLITESYQWMNQMNYVKQQGNDYLTSMVELAGYILPSMLIFTSAFLVFIVHLISRFLAKWLNMEIPHFPPIREWILPKAIFYYYILSIILISFPSVMDVSMIKLILVNLYPILQFLLMIQGISFALFYMNGKKWSGFLHFITLSVVILLQIMTIPILDFLGLFDLGFNLRKKLTFRG